MGIELDGMITRRRLFKGALALVVLTAAGAEDAERGRREDAYWRWYRSLPAWPGGLL